VPVGQFKIGLIAQERQPHLTNAVIGDPRVSDQEWARREGMVAFAGYPLLVGERLVGVVAMFARHPLTEASIEALAAVANTITLSIERLRSRDALVESELRVRQLTEHIHEVFFLYERDSAQMLYVSAAYEQIWGRSAQALYERRTDFIDAVYPDDRPGVYVMLDQLKQGENSQVEYRIVRPNGEVRWILARAFPFQSGTPSVYRVAGIAEDITERKQAEAQRQQLQAQLFEAQKMEALGTLAGGIAHDFNNILGIILGYSEMALEDAPADSAIGCNLQEVLSAGRRARGIVHQILTFSRKHEQERRPVQLHTVVQDALKLLHASLPATIDIRQHLDTTANTVLADATQMHQVLMNLGANAAHAMRETGGVLAVRLEAVEVTEDFATAQPSLVPGPYVRLTIQDTGHGMESAILERIFEPFFTTKPVGEGTGLGLPVVHGIVANHGGAMTVSSVPGKGTTFDIYLPRFDTTPAENLPEIGTIQGHERILFVDDEPTLARWGEQTLAHLGYGVVVCTSSVEALHLLRTAPAGI
jgi:PAS domain S-box-containing protein